MKTPYKLFGSEVGDGWKPVVQQVIDLCSLHNVEILQIKEKFGGLRFYVGQAPDVIFDAIDAAEALCAVTCEDCGKSGKLRNGGWLRTLCEDHYKEEVNAGRRIDTSITRI